MKFPSLVLTVFSAWTAFTSAHSTAGIEALVHRRLPSHAKDFTFALVNTTTPSHSKRSTPSNDEYTVSNGPHGKIHISGSSPSALSSGLRWYLTNYAHVDIYWFFGSRLDLAPTHLPPINCTYSGSSIVPWRYHFNTVTFSYTTAFWDWNDWQVQLDWMALRGINLPLAWVGYEKILSDVFLEAGFNASEVATFLSGPAFQAWNRFGNIQGSWGGDLPTSWLDGQFDLQKKIVARMVELGMTPVLPSFTGFVPSQIGRIYPNASFVTGDQWNKFPTQYTNVTFLEPFDPLFTTLQKSFISKQQEAYGHVTSIYTLDQYNENDPYSGDLSYLKNVTQNTMASLKAADPDAVWLLQGWLFYSSIKFWTGERVEAYLSGVEDSDMLILDLFSETQPQWQRTNSYYGKPWIWCQLHDYGGNMGLYGQVQNVTIDPIAALNNATSTMVGMGLTMEGQEGNEIMYDLLLDQAWASKPLDTEMYFRDWVTARYNNGPARGYGAHSLPAGVYSAWEIMRKTVYNNTDLAHAQAVTKSIFELSPNTTGLVNRTGHHATGIMYNPATLVEAWKAFSSAAHADPSLYKNRPYLFDLTDITRQVLANAFQPLYLNFVAASNHSNTATYSLRKATATGVQMIEILADLDAVLTASDEAAFNLAPWVNEARKWANGDAKTADFYEYNARNQITLWGPTGQISDYSSRQWGGLVRSYYVPRWVLFIEHTLRDETKAGGVDDELKQALLKFEEAWQMQNSGVDGRIDGNGSKGEAVEVTLKRVVRRWANVFGGN